VTRFVERLHMRERLCTHGRNKAMAAVCGLVLCTTVVLAGMAGADLSKARGALMQFKAEMKAVEEAQKLNDAGAFKSHQAQAEKHLAEARRLFDAANAGRASDPALLRDYADILFRQGDADLAAEVLERAVTYTPDDAGLWFELGSALCLLGHNSAVRAANALQRSLALDCTSTDAVNAYVALAHLYRREGLFDLARETFAKALKVDPEHVAARIGMAASKVRDGHVREGSEDIDALGALPAEYATQLSALLGQALDDFAQARRWFPDTPEDHMAYAKLLLRANRLPAALISAEHVAALDPEDYVAWNFVGGITRQLGAKDKARDAYERSLAIKPDQPRTREALEALDEPPAGEQAGS